MIEQIGSEVTFIESPVYGVKDDTDGKYGIVLAINRTILLSIKGQTVTFRGFYHEQKGLMTLDETCIKIWNDVFGVENNVGQD